MSAGEYSQKIIDRWKDDDRGLKEPSGNCRYKSKINGLFYNGIIMSPECAEHFFGPACEAIAKQIELEITLGRYK